MHSGSPSRRPRPRSLRDGLLLLGAFLLSLTPGCVTREAYQEVARERDALAASKADLERRVANLQRSNQNLDDERARLVGEVEDLFERKQKLESQLETLSTEREALSATLVATRTELEAQQEEVDRLRGTYEGLVQDLEAEVAAGQIEITELREGLKLNVSDEILFPPGSAELGPEGVAVLRKVAGQVASLEQRVEVQGHSDNVPIRGSLARRFPTNWELAAARASRVVRLLQQEGVAPGRLSAVSYGEHRPEAPNSSPASRARNRRIEIRLLPPEPAEERASAPGSRPAPAVARTAAP